MEGTSLINSFLLATGILAALAGAVKILIVFWKWIYPRTINCWYKMTGYEKSMQRLSRMELTMSSMEKLLVSIEKEMRPNHGTSLRDAIDQNKAMLKNLDQRMKANDIHSSLGLFDTDKTGAIIWVNRMFARITRRQIDELLGWNWINTVHVDDRDGVIEDYRTAIKEKREFHAYYRVVTFDNEILNLRVDTAILRYENGEFQGYRGKVSFVRCANEASCDKHICEGCDLIELPRVHSET